MSTIIESSLGVLCWLSAPLLLRPGRLRLHRRHLLMRLGGIGGFVCTFIFGWVGSYDGWWEGGGNDNWDVYELDPEPQVWLVSGNGYSNRVLSLAKGVPTIWEDGEWRGKWSKSIDLGLAVPTGSAEAGILGMSSVVGSPIVSTAVAIDVESDVSKSAWGVKAESFERMNEWYMDSNEENARAQY